MITPACSCWSTGSCETCRDFVGVYIRLTRREERRRRLRRNLLRALPDRLIELEWAFWNINDRVQAIEAAQ
jgi:hypothetical protein